MDDLDRAILRHLETFGFQQTSILSSSLGVGERTIHRRLTNVIQNNQVKVFAVPNYILFGYKAWARIGIKVKSGSLEKVASKLVNHPSIYYVAYVLGGFDIIISVFLKTIDQLSILVNSELAKINGIQFTETMLFVCPRKYNLFSWPETVNKNSDNKNIFGSYKNSEVVTKEYDIGETDEKILGTLMEDGLLRPKHLALKLGMGENPIRRRLKYMLNHNLYKLEVVPLTDIWEYETQATVGININTQFPNSVIDNILKNPAVFLASVAIGRFNIVIAARFPDSNSLSQFTTLFLPSIPGITATETYLHVKRLKYRSILWPVS